MSTIVYPFSPLEVVVVICHDSNAVVGDCFVCGWCFPSLCASDEIEWKTIMIRHSSSWDFETSRTFPWRFRRQVRVHRLSFNQANHARRCSRESSGYQALLERGIIWIWRPQDSCSRQRWRDLWEMLFIVQNFWPSFLFIETDQGRRPSVKVASSRFIFRTVLKSLVRRAFTSARSFHVLLPVSLLHWRGLEMGYFN